MLMYLFTKAPFHKDFEFIFPSLQILDSSFTHCLFGLGLRNKTGISGLCAKESSLPVTSYKRV